MVTGAVTAVGATKVSGAGRPSRTITRAVPVTPAGIAPIFARTGAIGVVKSRVWPALTGARVGAVRACTVRVISLARLTRWSAVRRVGASWPGPVKTV